MRVLTTAALCCAGFLAGHAAFAQSPATPSATNGFAGFLDSLPFNERIASFTLEPEVKVHINAPPAAGNALESDVANVLS